MKRKFVELTDDFLSQCRDEFDSDPINKIAKNAINSVGLTFSSTDASRLNEISHIFPVTLKKHGIKATDQGHSGRCWLFSGLNIYRHAPIRALNLRDFEFSEVYLFFYDKLERANYYLTYFEENPLIDPNDRKFDYMTSSYLSDGGHINMFHNLINKYGVVPRNNMKETIQSCNTTELNSVLEEKLNYTVNLWRKKKGVPSKEEVMKEIYNILVKFLGEPPLKFNWSYQTDNEDHEDNASILGGMNPVLFRNTLIPDIDFSNDYIALGNYPILKEGKIYELSLTSNMVGGNDHSFYNTNIEELIKGVTSSILNGCPVWFCADVNRSFNIYHSALDDKLDCTDTLLGQTYKFDKKDGLLFKNIKGCHAMNFIGLQTDEKDKVTGFQVENSWGSFDTEPGLDGFLYMSIGWFRKFVTEIVIHKRFLSRTMFRKIRECEREILNPWDNVSPAIFYKKPVEYDWKKIFQKRKGL